MWGATALAVAGIVIALFHSGVLTCLLLLLGTSCFFVAYSLHSTPDLSSHVTKLKHRLADIKTHLNLVKEDRQKLRTEIRHLMMAGSKVACNVAKLALVTEALQKKEAEFNHLILRYEATAEALERVEARLDAGVTRLHTEVSALTLLRV